jgi:hypothetical protein
MTDIYEGAPWTEMDIEDLKAEIESGRTIGEAAQFLCRSRDEVVLKCAELGLKLTRGRSQTSDRDP